MADKTTPFLCPSLTVTNIKNHVPIQLEIEKGLYSTWSHLFQTHCKAYRVLDHIIPPEKPSMSNVDQDEWDYVDDHVLTWIYGTISRDLMHTVISPGDTAQTTWVKIGDVFQDNKATWAIYLKDQFSHADMAKFTDVISYCLHLKNLADQLANVDS